MPRCHGDGPNPGDAISMNRGAHLVKGSARTVEKAATGNLGKTLMPSPIPSPIHFPVSTLIPVWRMSSWEDEIGKW
jgi:hypothetical protein